MSIEIFVLSDRQLGTLGDWQSTIDQLGFQLQLDHSRAINELSGYLPAQLAGKAAGFECDHWDPADVIDTYETVEFGHRWKHCLAFRFGGDFNALIAANAAAGAYALATDGVVYDSEGGELLTSGKALEVARKMERDMPERVRLLKETAARLIEKLGGPKNA